MMDGQSMLLEMQLLWHGPFVLVPQPGLDCVFGQSLAACRGVYLWTVEHGDGYLINYVGETGKRNRSFAVRLAEDVRWDLGGQAKANERATGVVCDPDLFRQGKRVPIAKNFTIEQYLADYPCLSAAVYNIYRYYRVFLGPTDADDATRQRIEAGIIRTLRATGGEPAAFLSNRKLIGPSPQPFQVRMESPVVFRGLSRMIDC